MRTPWPATLLRSFAVAAVVLSSAPLAAQNSPGKLPPVSGVKSATAAGDLLRELYFKTEYYDGIALGDSLVKKFPGNSRVRAWYVAHVAVTGHTFRADSLTAKIDTTTRDPWLLAARSFSLHNPPAASKAANAQAIRLARRAQKLAPREQDFVWLVANHMLAIPGFPIAAGEPIVAYIDSVTQPLNRSSEVQLMRATASYSPKPFTPGAPTPPDTASQNEALRAFAAVRAQDSMSLGAHLDASYRVRTKDDALALALGKRAVQIAPRSPNARRNYWALIEAQRGPSVAEKRAAIAADRSEFLAMTDSAPWALDAVSNGMKYITKEPTDAIDDRILAKAPRSSFAETVLLNRANQWRDSLYAARDSARPGPKSDSNVVRRRWIEATEEFINKPWTADPAIRERAIQSLFFEVRADSTYPAPNLIRLVRQVVEAKSIGAPELPLR